MALTSEQAARLRSIKGARRGHATLRAAGRVPGDKARAAWQAMTPEQRRVRKLQRQRERELDQARSAQRDLP